jgi:hypothetical protein
MFKARNDQRVNLFPRLPSTVYCLPIVLAATISQAAPVAIADRAVDMVSLVGGEQVLGMFVAPPTDGSVVLYVSREWLQKRQPALYRKVTAGEDDRRKQALQQYIDRLKEWRSRRAEPKLLNNFIERSIRDVQTKLKALNEANVQSEPSQLLILEFPAAQVRRQFAQPPVARRLLGLAWEARLTNAEELSAAALSEQLKEREVDVEHATPDLTDRFEIVPLSDRQWAAKVALIEFSILGKPHFQGSGSVLLRDDGDGARPNLAELLNDMVQDQLGGDLSDLLNPQLGRAESGPAAKQRAAVEKALASARDDKATGVRITYLDQSIANQRVTVSDTFYARMPDDGWQAIWQQSSNVSTADVKDLGEDQIAADPQVAEILKIVKGLGLDANGDLMKSALRFGGATQKAMQATEVEFSDYLLDETRRLIGPPVIVPAK